MFIMINFIFAVYYSTPSSLVRLSIFPNIYHFVVL
jgi:hypothetical protein